MCSALSIEDLIGLYDREWAKREGCEPRSHILSVLSLFYVSMAIIKNISDIV